MFKKDMKLAVFLLFITLGLNSAAPFQKCFKSSEVRTKLNHHKDGYLKVNKILGKDLNVECLKNVEFSSIYVSGLENYRICSMKKNLKVTYPSISVRGRHKSPISPFDNTSHEGEFTIKLTDLIMNFLINEENEDILTAVQLGSRAPSVTIPTNESLLKCISSTDSLIAQQVIKYAKHELKTVIEETSMRIGVNLDQSQENENSMKKKIIVFYYNLLRFLYVRDNT